MIEQYLKELHSVFDESRILLLKKAYLIVCNDYPEQIHMDIIQVCCEVLLKGMMEEKEVSLSTLLTTIQSTFQEPSEKRRLKPADACYYEMGFEEVLESTSQDSVGKVR